MNDTKRLFSSPACLSAPFSGPCNHFRALHQGCNRHEMTSERNPHSDANLQNVKAKVIKVSLVFFSTLVLCASVNFDAGKGPRGFSRRTQTRNSRSWSNEVEPRVHARHAWEKLHVPLLSLEISLVKSNVKNSRGANFSRRNGPQYPRLKRDWKNAERRTRRDLLEGHRQQNTHTQTTRSKTDKHTFGHMNRILRRVS